MGQRREIPDQQLRRSYGGNNRRRRSRHYAYRQAVPTVKGVLSVDLITGQQVMQMYERADTCVVPNVGIIAENMLATVLLGEIQRHPKYCKLIER